MPILEKIIRFGAVAKQKQIEALTADLQKLSAGVEANKPAPKVVNNP